MVRTTNAGADGRSDGRSDAELRQVALALDYTDNPLGSVLCSMGRTRVLCTVTEEPSVPRWLRGSNEGWITAEYSMLPGSTDTRVEREATRGRLSGRTQEIQRLIGRSLRAVADLSALGERTLWVDCDVLQADGGTRTASITGAYTALALACRNLTARGDVTRNPMRDAVAAVSVGLIDGRLMLDLCYEEDARADVDMNVVATGDGSLVEVQGTGEGATFSVEELHGLTDLALGGVARLIQIQREALSG
jgi:ribonuclease PH